MGLWSVNLAATQVKLWFFGGPNHGASLLKASSLDPGEGISVLVNSFLLLQPPDISKCFQLLSTGTCLPQEAWHAAVHGVAKSRTRLSD